jgi:putative peptidoglycan binding protein
MKGSGVFRWLMPAALAVFLSVPVQTANARGMGGGGGHMGGGMGGGHMGAMGGRGRPMMGTRFFRGGMGGRGRPMMGTRSFSRNRMSSFARSHDPRFGTRFVNRGDRSFDRRGRFGNERFGREGRFEGREGEERGEREFFFRHNFFVGFNFGAFGWWPWWGWGGPWWGWDGWGYPYPYGGYGYYPYYGDPQGYGSQYNGSQYDAEYWNNLAMSVQTKLADQGYYHGQVDGVIGSGTIEAVRQFQADHGLSRTGKIDPKLLKSLSITYKAPARAQA